MSAQAIVGAVFAALEASAAGADRENRTEGAMSKDRHRNRGPFGAERAAHPSDDEYSSIEQKDGDRVGFTGGENVGRRDEFAGRENVTEERQDRAIPADGVHDRDVSQS
jgi:hypothetical protein